MLCEGLPLRSDKEENRGWWNINSRFLSEKTKQLYNIMLEIRNLHAEVEGREILRGINLTIRDGEVHVLMGPNGW